MKKRKEETEIFFEIKKDVPEFDREELLEYTKWGIPQLYNALKNKQEIQCKEELKNKLLKEKNKFKINENMDHINIQYMKLFDYIKKDNEAYIQIYASVYFFDNVKNNKEYNFVEKNKYWNDIWIITYKQKKESKLKNSNKCNNCGAIMKYDNIKKIVECEYCGNIVYDNFYLNWEIEDIELWN